MTARYIDLSNECISNNSKTYQNIVNSVPANIETDILSVVIPPDLSFLCCGGSASGMTDSVFRIYLDSVLKEEKRIAWTDRNVGFKIQESITAGKIAKITVKHHSVTPHDFSATIYGVLY